MAVLARVTGDVDAERGPDLAWEIRVPESWFAEQAVVQARLPRLLGCARCAGGGCDGCQRRGAFSRADCGAPASVEVRLPRAVGNGREAVCLRLPGCGARATEDGVPPGHLLLTLRAAPHGADPDPRLQRTRTPASWFPARPPVAIWAGLSVLVMLGLLWLALR